MGAPAHLDRVWDDVYILASWDDRLQTLGAMGLLGAVLLVQVRTGVARKQAVGQGAVNWRFLSVAFFDGPVAHLSSRISLLMH